MDLRAVNVLFFVLIISPFLGNYVFGQEDKLSTPREKQLFSILNQELQAAMKASKTRGHQNPDLLYRIMEIQADMFKLHLDLENKKFMMISPQERMTKPKHFFFPKSYALYLKINSLGKKIISTFPDFNELGEVYYTMGMMASEFQDKNATQNYMQQALKRITSKGPIYIEAMDILANSYFNDNQYIAASKLYTELLNFKNHQWWHRFAYNQAWCYLKMERYQEALELIKIVAEGPSKKKQLSMATQALSQIHNFFIFQTKMDEGIMYLQKKAPDRIMLLIKLALSKRPFKDVLPAITQAKTTKFTTSDQLISFHLELLTLYDQHNQFSAFRNEIRELVSYYDKNYFTQDQRKNFITTLTNKLVTLQEDLKKVTYDPKREWIVMRIALVETILNALIKINPNEKDLYYSFKGEIYFFKKEDLLTIKYLTAANKLHLQKSQDQQKAEFVAGNSNTMLLTLGRDLNHQIPKAQYLYIYHEYLKYHQKTKIAEQIYPKLFNIYFEAQNFSKALDNIYLFYENVPNELKTQQSMVIKLLNHYHSEKDISGFNKILDALKKGDFKFSPDYLKTAQLILDEMFFERTNKLLQDGKKENALEQYLNYFKDLKFSTQLRLKCAYNAAMVYKELGDYQNATIWLLNWFTFTSEEEKLQKIAIVESFTNEFFLRRRIEEAALFAEKVFTDTCKLKFKEKKSIYRRSVLYRNALEQHDKTIENLLAYQNCNIGPQDFSELAIEIIEDKINLHEMDVFYKYHQKFSSDPFLKDKMLEYHYKLYLSALLDEDLINADIIKKSLDDNLKLLNISNQLQASIKSHFNADAMMPEYRALNPPALAFPEEQFGQIVNQRLAMLSDQQNKAQLIIAGQNPQAQIIAYVTLIQIYRELVDELKSFNPTPPPDLTPEETKEYLAQFKDNMTPLGSKLENDINDFTSSANKAISKSKLLTRGMDSLFRSTSYPGNIHYQPLLPMMPIDKGGTLK